jgi:hypothetical protein
LAGNVGDGGPSGAATSRAAVAIRRHRVVVGLAVLALLAVLVFVPEQASSPTSVATTAIPTSITVPHGVTPPNPTYGHGVAVSGVTCGPGVRQVTWSAYAPPCQPAWSGNNGGATSRGVTGSTITISYRAATTTQLSLLYSLVPPTVIGTNTEEEATMQAYINTFNKSFELYGRKVVLVPFQGKGDFIEEDIGQDQAQAEEDAVTVSQTIKAFADMSLVDSSAVYSTDLAAQHVVTSSLYENALTWYKEYAPWEYTPGPNCTKAAEATAAILGKQLGGLPASDAGTAALRHKTRVYGIIYPQNPESAQCANLDIKDMAKYGQKVVKSVGVEFNLSELVSQADTAVAAMKAAGVTTIIMSSADPITPRFMMTEANRLNYHPEWWFQSYFAGSETNTTSLTDLFPAPQVDHIIGVGMQTRPLGQQEAIKAYDLGNPDPGVKPIPSYSYTYETLLQFFDALQLAGPDLTPKNFEAAMARIPTSAPGGMLGGWSGKDGPFDPSSTYSVVAFKAGATDPLDGKKGAFVSCDGGRVFSYDQDGADVPAHQQLKCSSGRSGSSGSSGTSASGTSSRGQKS